MSCTSQPRWAKRAKLALFHSTIPCLQNLSKLFGMIICDGAHARLAPNQLSPTKQALAAASLLPRAQPHDAPCFSPPAASVHALRACLQSRTT